MAVRAKWSRIGGMALAAAITNGGIASAEANEAEFREVFRNGEKVIVLTNNEIVIDSKRYSLENCGNAKYYCYESQEIGFLVSAPKDCGRWGRIYAEADERVMIVSPIPHTPFATYRVKGEKKFLYDYHDTHGLVSIYYDEGRDLFTELEKMDYGYLEKVKYEKVSERHLFDCS